MMINPCIYTGALVRLWPENCYIRCDVFYVGRAVIFTGYHGKIYPSELSEDISAKKFLSSEDCWIDLNLALEKEPQGFIAISQDYVQWSEKARQYLLESYRKYGAALPFVPGRDEWKRSL